MVSDAKSLPREGEVAMKTYDSVTPTVDLCLSELTTELQELLAWAAAAGVDQKVWGLDPVAFLADALKRRNPVRAAAAVREAAEAAQQESGYNPSQPSPAKDHPEREVGATSSAFGQPWLEGSASSDDSAAAAEPTATSGLTEAEVAELLAQLQAGTVYRAGEYFFKLE